MAEATKAKLRRWIWWYFRLVMVFAVIHFGFLVAGVYEEDPEMVLQWVYLAFKYTFMLPAVLALPDFDLMVEESFLHFAWIQLANGLVHILAYALYRSFMKQDKAVPDSEPESEPQLKPTSEEVF